MLDNITSLFDNYKGKIRNPFIGTIISVWLIHNWRVPFALFNFDDDCTMQDKINYIADYFGKQDFWSELGEIIFYSFLILVFTFLLMAISRVLTDTYYKIIEPFFITKIDKKSIFTEIEKTKLENRINSLTKKVEYKNDEIDKVLTRQDLDGSSFLQINFISGHKILITHSLIGFKPHEMVGFDAARIPKVVTTVDLLSVSKALEELFDADETPNSTAEIEVLKKVYQSIMIGAENIGFKMSSEKRWFSSVMHNPAAFIA